MTGKVKFKKVRDGRYVEESTGIELVKGIDDGRIEWQAWTPDIGRPLGIRYSLNEIKRAVREFIDAGKSIDDDFAYIPSGKAFDRRARAS